MKINKLEIYNYGKLKHKIIDLNEFQAIYGKNEAGKTTMINFIKDLLFGFTKRSTTHPYAPKDKSEMGGKLYITVSDIDYVIERVEGKNGGILSFTNSQEQILPEEKLKQILGPINRDTFDALFYFGAPNLNEVAKLSKDELETRIRQVGVVGIEQWLELKKELEKEADSLYKARGKNPELNQKLNEYQKKKQQLLESQKDYGEYLDLVAKQQQLVQESAELKLKQQHDFKKLRELQIDQQNWKNYEQLKSNQQHQIEILAGFTAKDLEELNNLNNQKQFLSTHIDQLKIKLENENNSLQHSSNYKLYLANQNRFDDLYLQIENQINNVHKLESIKRDLQNAKQQVETDNFSAGGNDSLLFDETTKQLVNQLNAEKLNLKAQATVVSTQNSNSQGNSNWLIFLIAGLISLILGAVIGGIGFTISALGIIMMGIGLYLKFNPNNSQTVSPKNDYEAKIQKIDQQLQKIGNEYQIRNVDPVNWTSSLQSEIQKRNIDRQRVNLLQSELNEVNQKVVKYLNEWNPLEINADTPSESLSRIKQFMQENQRQTAVELQRKEKISEKQTEILDYQNQIGKVNQTKNLFFQKRNINSDSDFKKQYESQVEAQKMLEKTAELQNSLTDEIINRLSQYEDQQVLSAKVTEMSTIDKENVDSITKLSEQISSIKAKIDALAKNGTYDEIRQELVIQEAEINDLVSKWLVYKMTDEWIEKVLNLASHDRFPQVQLLVKKYFKTLTNGHYVDVEYGKKIKVKTNDKLKFEVKELSRGTMQQLYLAMIFALTMSFSDEYPMPIILDDGFIEFDHVRTAAAIELLQEISDITQVIYFTADDRIETKIKLDNLIKLG